MVLTAYRQRQRRRAPDARGHGSVGADGAGAGGACVYTVNKTRLALVSEWLSWFESPPVNGEA